MSAHTAAAKELLAKLVGFDTTSHLSNLELVHFIRDYLARLGVEAVLIPDETGRKAALFATIGPPGDGGVALSAHTDVVPVAGQDWSTDPFVLTERAGKLYGRGACDMKGFVAACLAMVPDFVAADLAQPIHLAFSYDEEVGCLGVRPMAARMGVDLPRAQVVIVGEPTMMRAVDAHKSVFAFETVITGHEVHSSTLEQGVNAIEYGVRFINALTDMGARLREPDQRDARFDPAYSSVHVGEISGGTALNIVPRQCRIHWEIRGLPGADIPAVKAELDAFVASELVPKMRVVAPETGIETRPLVDALPLSPDPGSPAETLVKRLIRDNATQAVSYATDAGYFQERDMATIVCGPGSIDQAHQRDEFLSVEQLGAGLDFLGRLTSELAR
ncbi:MAG: acetylornithine deacetylase [Alphaproteobacteria bacterium]